jgi:hypothetical protein
MSSKFGKFGFEILKKYVVMKLESFAWNVKSIY